MINMDRRATEIKEEYLSSLVDLNVNSKPLINMLTILAEENHDHASVIVEAVEQHIAKVPADGKLPILYLIDSIVKNVGRDYNTLFSQCIVHLFCGVFQEVNEKIREKMFNLRQTWNDVFPQTKLYTLDVKINCIDNGWPITATVARIHVNPNFFRNTVQATEPITGVHKQLQEKQRELLELQKKKLELELVATKKKILEEEKKISLQTASIASDDISQILPDSVTSSRINIPSSNNVASQINSKLKVNPVNPALITSSMKSRDPRLARKHMFNNNSNNIHDNIQRLQPSQPSQIIINTSNRSLSNNINTNKTNSIVNSVFNNIEDNDSQLSRFNLKVRNNINNNNNIDNISSSLAIDVDEPKKSKSSSSSRSLLHKSNANSNNYGSSKSSSSSSRRNDSGAVFSKHSSGSSSSSKSSRESSSKRSSSDKKKRRTSPSATSSTSKRSSSRSPSKSSSPRKRRDEFKSPSKKQSSPSSSVSTPSPASQSDLNKLIDAKAAKSRSYSNRNSSRSSKSADTITKTVQPKDVDLRPITGPPADIATLNDDKFGRDASLIPKEIDLNSLEEQNTIFEASMDIDLRLLPAVPPTAQPQVIVSLNNVLESDISATTLDDSDENAKKRKSTSLETLDEPANKRTKSEKLDILFGSEDVDLRTLNTGVVMNPVLDIIPNAKVDDLTPPPPPIISNKVETTNWTKIKNNTSEKRDKKSVIKSNFEAIRAKLAEASKTKDRLARPLLYNKLSDDPIERRRKLLNSKSAGSAISENIEARIRNEDLLDDTSQDGLNTNINIIMAQAQEQLDSEKIDIEQYNNLVKQVIQINETKKIREAKRIELKNNKSKESSSSSNRRSSSEALDHDMVLSDGDSKTASSSKNKNDENKKNLNVDLSYANSTAADLRNTHRGSSSKNLPSESRRSKTEAQNSKCSPWETDNWKFRANASAGQNNSSTGLRQPFGRNDLPYPWQNPAFENNMLRVQTAITATTAPTTLTNRSEEIMRTINIDGVAREIRFYDEIALIFMNWEEPKEIYFQMGTRKLTVDDMFSIDLNFNDIYKPFIIDNNTYQIKLGSPTRELYIDKLWYECYFGDPAISIVLDGKIRVFKIEGPPPQVKIGNLRTDLVAGKISMIINAEITVQLFLDNKVQYFEIDGLLNTVQFGDYLLSVLINDEPISVEFGGLPKSILIRGKKHFVRFTGLPRNITPGRHYIKDMIKTNLYRDLKSPPIPINNNMININSAVSNVETSATNLQLPLFNNFVGIPGISSSADTGPILPKHESASSGLDYLTNLLSAPIATTSLNNSGYQIEQSETAINPSSITSNPNDAAKANNINPLLGNMNVDELYRKLLATGILSNKDKAKETEKKEKEKIIPISLSHPETIKKRQSAIVNTIYSGMQCSCCGVRFPPEKTKKYSQHLDWHFRQNRRDQDSARRAHSRKWYYDVSDWIQYEEIEDLDEREKNWFESQQPDDIAGKDAVNKGPDTPPPSCPAGPEDVDIRCVMCHDLFEQFYHEETEEWHLRSAMRVEDKLYHPVCYEDYKASLTLDESALNNTMLNKEESTSETGEVVVKQEKLDEDCESREKIEIDPNDDDVIELPAEVAEITEIIDEEEDAIPDAQKDDAAVEDSNENTKEADENKVDDSEMTEGGESESAPVNQSIDDDVQIQEPHIEITDLDLIDDIPPNPDSLLPADETSQMSQNSLFLVKIKEEPKDDGYEDEDAFEEVGTVENLFELSTETPSVQESVADDLSAETPPAPSDGNVEMRDTPAAAATTSGSTNKIKINIAKSTNKTVVSNINVNINENSSDITQDNEVAVPVEENNATEENANEEVEIDYELKPDLKDVELVKMKLIKNGYETSGLCSIM